MTLKTILNPLKPFRILSLMMSYMLGLGLVQYVAQIRSTERALEGGLFLLSFLIALDYLCGLQRTLQFDLWKETSDIDLIRIRWAYRIVAAFFITFCTSMLVGWMVQGMLWTGMTVLLVVIFVTGVFYYLAQIHDNLQPYQVLVRSHYCSDLAGCDGLFYPIVIDPPIPHHVGCGSHTALSGLPVVGSLD